MDMELVLDRYGRVGFPKALRKDFNLGPGSRLKVREMDREIILCPEEETPTCQQKGPTLVFTGGALGSITDSVSQMRQERDQKTGGM
jgi:AbrB family looped-hinge helix DNA binding protein